jgi:hypothetical protein
MHYTIEKLLAGDESVANHFRLAGETWKKFYSEHAGESVAQWGDWITNAQLGLFEHQFGGRLLGQEVMAWSAIATLYTTQAGFEDNRAIAVKVVKAFAASYVSLEVKSHLEYAARSYHLDEEAELKGVWKSL